MTPLYSKTRLAAALLLAGTLLSTGACRGKHSRTTVENEEPEGGPRIASTLKMNDPAATQQLIKGFSTVESGTWRWTAKNFTVVLRPPIASPQRGGVLNFSIVIPDVVIQKLSNITLTATCGTTKLKSETYSKPGNYTFSTDVPPDLLAKDAVTFDFALDKALPPNGADTRELGVIATSVGLESK